MTDETRDAVDTENRQAAETDGAPVEGAPADVEQPADEPSGASEQTNEPTLRQEETESGEGTEPQDAERGELEGESSEERTESQDEAEAGEAETSTEPQEAGQADQAAGEGEQQVAQEEGQAPTVESVIEAILFATDEPLTESKLANIVETTTKQVRESVKALNERYEAHHNAFRIERIAGGYQMLTLSVYNHWLKKMLRTRSESKLSPAAMETLAIIAYKQPIIRADIEAIRGVAVGEVIRSLMYKGLVKIVGRAEILGRPMLYGTTKKFLEVFGLNSLKDLPKAEELKNPDRG